jgi:hypothetical protein
MFLLFFTSSCATPVGVKRTSDQEVYRQLSANALSGERPSFFSRQFLERLSLTDWYEKDPKAALAELHKGLGCPDEGDRLLALLNIRPGEKRSTLLPGGGTVRLFLSISQ